MHGTFEMIGEYHLLLVNSDGAVIEGIQFGADFADEVLTMMRQTGAAKSTVRRAANLAPTSAQARQALRGAPHSHPPRGRSRRG
jgi:hypothetical protein